MALDISNGFWGSYAWRLCGCTIALLARATLADFKAHARQPSVEVLQQVQPLS